MTGHDGAIVPDVEVVVVVPVHLSIFLHPGMNPLVSLNRPVARPI